MGNTYAKIWTWLFFREPQQLYVVDNKISIMPDYLDEFGRILDYSALGEEEIIFNWGDETKYEPLFPEDPEPKKEEATPATVSEIIENNLIDPNFILDPSAINNFLFEWGDSQNQDPKMEKTSWMGAFNSLKWVSSGSA
jgi:hypothetical protein